jgi:hypothetical protein
MDPITDRLIDRPPHPRDSPVMLALQRCAPPDRRGKTCAAAAITPTATPSA